jgi:hypothetical protein
MEVPKLKPSPSFAFWEDTLVRTCDVRTGSEWGVGVGRDDVDGGRTPICRSKFAKSPATVPALSHPHISVLFPPVFAPPRPSPAAPPRLADESHPGPRVPLRPGEVRPPERGGEEGGRL